MSPGEQTTIGTCTAHQWSADKIFEVFAEPIRRKLLLALARQDSQPPSQLKDKVERNLDLTMKRLATMQSDGLVVLKPDAADKRRQLCSLAPGLPLITTEKGRVLDFSYLKVPVDGLLNAEAMAADAARWDPDVVYYVISDPARRRMIAALARTPDYAQQLKSKAGLKASATLKHLEVLCSAGFTVTRPDPADRRRFLYSLSPKLPLQVRDNEISLEFGFCTISLYPKT